jgi:uncharacterized protein (TIGR02001 family)
MKLRWACRFVCALGVVNASAAQPQWGGAVVLNSTYLSRGVSRSDGDPSISAELHGAFRSGWSIGVLALSSKVGPLRSVTAEISATLGFARPLNENWAAHVALTRYTSPWSALPRLYEYDELTADLIYRERLYLTASFSPNTSRVVPGQGLVWNRDASSLEASYQQSLAAHLRGVLGIGYYDLHDLVGAGYWYSSVGLSTRHGAWRADLSYVATDHVAKRISYGGAADNRVLASLIFSF